MWRDRVGDAKIQFYLNTTIRVQISDTQVFCGDEDMMKKSLNGGSDSLDPYIFLNICYTHDYVLGMHDTLTFVILQLKQLILFPLTQVNYTKLLIQQKYIYTFNRLRNVSLSAWKVRTMERWCSNACRKCRFKRI